MDFMTDEQADAYGQGFRTGAAGLPMYYCPYIKGDPERVAWRAGWKDARRNVAGIW